MLDNNVDCDVIPDADHITDAVATEWSESEHVDVVLAVCGVFS